MAIFDRRLLAYFDDGGFGMSGVTLLDRTTEYQRCLAEIEHELGKYQRLLGSQRVKLRLRDRGAWVSHHRSNTPVAERCGPRAAAAGHGESGTAAAARPAAHVPRRSVHISDAVVEQPVPQAAAPPQLAVPPQLTVPAQALPEQETAPSSAASSQGRHRTFAAGAMQEEERRAAQPEGRRRTEVLRGEVPEPQVLQEERRVTQPDAGHRRSEAFRGEAVVEPQAVQEERRVVQPDVGRRRSEAFRGESVVEPQVPEAVAQRSVMETTWAQLDMLTGLPLLSSAEWYTVIGGWEGQEPSATEARQPRAASRGTGAECVVRQQLRLPGGPGARWVVLRVLRRHNSGEEIVGHCKLDGLDTQNYEVRSHELLSASGLPTGLCFRLRLHTPSAAARASVRPAAVVQDPQAAPRSVADPNRGSVRGSVSGSGGSNTDHGPEEGTGEEDDDELEEDYEDEEEESEFEEDEEEVAEEDGSDDAWSKT